MNSLLVTSNGKAEKRMDAHACFRCKRVFCNHRALRGHLRVHQEKIRSGRHFNNPDYSHIYIDSASTNPSLLIDSQPVNLSQEVSKPLPCFDGEALAFSKRFFSDETSPVDATMIPGNNLANAKSLSFLSLRLSSPRRSADINHSNTLSSTGNSSSNTVERSLNTCAFPATIVFPSDLSLSVGRREFCKFSADRSQTWMYDTPVSAGHVIRNRPFFDLNKPPRPQLVLGSNKLRGFKESDIGSFPLGPCQSPPQNEVGHSSKGNRDGNKRPYFSDVSDDANIINASKKLKIKFQPPVPTERIGHKQRLLLKDIELFSRLEISVDAEVDGQGVLDLSLHL